MERMRRATRPGAGIAVQYQGDPRRGFDLGGRNTQDAGSGDAHDASRTRHRRACLRRRAITWCSAACASPYPRAWWRTRTAMCVIHALCDAVLGAHRRRRYRPAFSGQRSALSRRRQPRVLACSCGPHAAAGLQLVNADVTVLAEAPRIAAHRAAMAANLAADLRGAGAAASTSKRPPRSAWDSSGAGEGLAAHGRRLAVGLGAAIQPRSKHVDGAGAAVDGPSRK